MVPCRSCKMFHDLMLNCKVAANQLMAGTLKEPWLTANKLVEVKERKAAQELLEKSPVDSLTASTKQGIPRGITVRDVPVAAPKKAVKVVGRPRVYADPEARRKEYIREYMRARRAKKP